MYRLVLIDLDGTLLTKELTISEENKEAVRRAKEKGTEIVITTGRTYSDAVQYAKALEIKYLVTCNGAVIEDTEKKRILKRESIKDTSVATIINKLEKEQAAYLLYAEQGIYLNEFSSHYFAEWSEVEGSLTRPLVVENVFEYVQKEKITVDKIFILCHLPEKLEVLRNSFHAIEKKLGIKVTSSAPDNFEITDEKVHKGNAVEYLCQLLDIPKAEAIAIGDSENDLDMIKLVGLGVAMGNAPSHVKEVANHITGNNMENGVAMVLDEFIE